jgi:hypothetical protein
VIPAASLHGAPQDGAARVSLIDEEIERLLGAPTAVRDGSSYADLSVKVVDPLLADRQLRLRRVVTYVMVGALALLVLAAMCGIVHRPRGTETISHETARSLEAMPSIAAASPMAEVSPPTPSDVASPIDTLPPAAAVAASNASPSVTSQRQVSHPVRTKIVPKQKMRSLSLVPRSP